MTSAADVLTRPKPRVRVTPKAAWSDGDDAVLLAHTYGLDAKPWQAAIVIDWLGRAPGRHFVASTLGLAVPRQNGKNVVIEIRELYGMVVLGECILHTAHQVKTARKAFKRLLRFFDPALGAPPELAGMVSEIRRTNGQEAIVLTNGGQVEFVARSKGSARGYSVDVLVLDEAQDLTDDELEALLSTISAAPLGDPQIVFTGTPPNDEKGEIGEVWKRVRADGVNHTDPKLCWIDYGVADGPLPDIDDRSTWEKANPELGGYLLWNVAETERRRLSAEGFARERLGWWGDPKAGAKTAVIPLHVLEPMIDLGSSIVDTPTFGFDIAPERDWAAIGVVGRNADGRMHVEITSRARKNGERVADHREGVVWAIPRLVKIAKRRPDRSIRVVLAARSAAESLVPAILQAANEAKVRIEVVALSSADVAAACGYLYDQAFDGGLAHLDQPPLNDAIVAARKKNIGDAAFVWGRRGSAGDITALYGVTLPAWVHSSTKPTYDVLDSVG